MRHAIRWCAALAGLGLAMSAGAVTLEAPEVLEPGQKLSARVAMEGQGDAAWSVTYSLQADSSLYAAALPDPVYGKDIALGAASWTESEGKVIERGSLTDGKDYTEGSTDWSSHTEAFQYVDLGQPRRITRITYGAGDANHAWQVDVSASLDGKTYTPIPGLQGFDQYKKWGTVVMPLAQPVTARYLRLRHYKAGEKTPVLRMPTGLSVYVGARDEDFALPSVGEVIGQGQTSVKAGQPAAIAVPKPLGPGLYLLAARLQSGTRHELLYRHVLVLPPILKSVGPDSRFGINASNAQLTAVLRRLGVGWVRFENLKWPFYSPEPGVYRFDGSVKPWQVDLDSILKGYTDNGMTVLPFLFLTASYASSAGADIPKDRWGSYPPKDPAGFGEFAFQAAARYGTKAVPADQLKTEDKKTGLGYLRYYEMWNEQNLTDPGWGPWVGTVPQYMDLFRAGAEAVRRADPAAKVTNGGYAGIQVKTVDTLRTYAYADGKHPLDFVDVLNVHFYSGRVPPELSTDDLNARQTGDIRAEDEFRKLAAWRDKYKPGMPIWLTETGYDSAGPFGTDEHTQAARMPRVIMLALANGMDKVFLYRESGSDASMHAASGVVRNDGSYKPSFLSYGTLIRQFEGVKGGGTKLPAADPNVRVYLWQRGKETLLTAWTIDGPGKLPVNLGRATVTDTFGRTTERDLSKGIDLTEFPVYIAHPSNEAAVRGLVAELDRQRAAEKQRRDALAKRAAFLFKFGGPVDGVTMDIGTERPYTPVLGTDVWAEGKEFGFAPEGTVVDERPWSSSELDRKVCRLPPGKEFRFRVTPGRYTLRVAVSSGQEGHLALKGAGPDRSLPYDKGEPIVEQPLSLTAPTVLSIGLDTWSNVRWLTLVPVL